MVSSLHYTYDCILFSAALCNIRYAKPLTASKLHLACFIVKHCLHLSLARLCKHKVQSVLWGSAGPRRTGEGTEDEEQGIISAESTATGYACSSIPHTMLLEPCIPECDEVVPLAGEQWCVSPFWLLALSLVSILCSAKRSSAVLHLIAFAFSAGLGAHDQHW